MSTLVTLVTGAHVLLIPKVLDVLRDLLGTQCQDIVSESGNVKRLLGWLSRRKNHVLNELMSTLQFFWLTS